MNFDSSIFFTLVEFNKNKMLYIYTNKKEKRQATRAVNAEVWSVGAPGGAPRGSTVASGGRDAGADRTPPVAPSVDAAAESSGEQETSEVVARAP